MVVSSDDARASCDPGNSFQSGISPFLSLFEAIEESDAIVLFTKSMSFLTAFLVSCHNKCANSRNSQGHASATASIAC